MLDDKRSAIRSVKECRGCVQGRRAHDVMAEFLSVAVKLLGADDAKEALKEWPADNIQGKAQAICE